MSRRYVTTATIELGKNEDEQDLPVRCHVELEPSLSRGWTATLDGDLEIFLRGAWVPADGSGASLSSVERAGEALCDLALEDDSSQCVEEDRDE